jgi:hypothetical protein
MVAISALISCWLANALSGPVSVVGVEVCTGATPVGPVVFGTAGISGR